MAFSILILTLNEEKNLSRCLEAISWCDDVVVLDSFSSDKTENIAKKSGVRFYQRQFDDFARQRNYGMDEIPFKHDWIFHLDADEVFTIKLRDEVNYVICDTKYRCFNVPSKMMFHDTWLKRSGMYPTYQVRLTKIGDFKFKQVGHGQREDVEPSCIGTLSEPYSHYSFSNGLAEWFDKHNRYSGMEAIAAVEKSGTRGVAWLDLISRKGYRRRRAFKEISAQMPFRPVLRFLYMYILRLGILEGLPGLYYSAMLSIYEFMIVLKIKEIQRAKKGLPL